MSDADGNGDTRKGDGADRPRPVPVRAAMGERDETPPPVETPSRTVEIDGEAWLVRVEGRALSGTPPDRGTALLFLTFARDSEPGTRLRETIAPGRSVDELAEAHLGELWRQARPYEDDWSAGELFPGTRRGGPSRG